MPKQFTWLAADTFPARGPKLEKGKDYDAANFEADAVAGWIAAKDAKWIDVPAKKAGRKAGEEE
jgi:hypothetical protein